MYAVYICGHCPNHNLNNLLVHHINIFSFFYKEFDNINSCSVCVISIVSLVWAKNDNENSENKNSTELFMRLIDYICDNTTKPSIMHNKLLTNNVAKMKPSNVIF